MNIIASIIIAGSTVFVNTPEEALNYNPPSDTLELHIVPVETSVLTNIPAVVTNEPWKTLFEMREKVDALWTAHTNLLARIEAHKAKAEEHKRAIDRVKENAKKHKSVMGKSVPTGKRPGGAK